MNSWHIQQLKFAFGIGGFMSFYGVVGLVVWLVGEKMGFPASQRIIVIALVLLTLPLALVLGYVATKRKEKKENKEAEAKADEKSGESKAQKVAPVAADDDLSKGAEEVVQFLKSSNLGAGGKDAPQDRYGQRYGPPAFRPHRMDELDWQEHRHRQRDDDQQDHRPVRIGREQHQHHHVPAARKA